MNHDDDDDEVRDDRDDEQPTIVVLKEGDLSEEQVKAEKNGDGGNFLSLFLLKVWTRDLDCWQ